MEKQKLEHGDYFEGGTSEQYSDFLKVENSWQRKGVWTDNSKVLVETGICYAEPPINRKNQHDTGHLTGLKTGVRLNLHTYEEFLEKCMNTFYHPFRKVNILALEKERFKWSTETFPEATALSSMLKLKGEADEIIKDIENGISEPLEYADVLMCLFDSAGRQGISPLDIFHAFEQKLEINKSRTWVKNPDNSYSHVKKDQ